MEILTFWNVFMELGGRWLLVFLLIDILLLLILEVTKYGYAKNYRVGEKVSGRNKKWINRTVSRRAKFDGLETLETDRERVSTRPSVLETRLTSTYKGIPVNDGYGQGRDDGVIVDIKSGTIRPIRLNQSELSETADSVESLSHPFTSKQVGVK